MNTGERYWKNHLKLDVGIIQTYSKNNFTKEGEKSPVKIMHYVVVLQKEMWGFFLSNLGEYVNNHLNQALTSACALLGLLLINKLSAYDITVSTQVQVPRNYRPF